MFHPVNCYSCASDKYFAILTFTGKKAMLQNQDIHLRKYTYDIFVIILSGYYLKKILNLQRIFNSWKSDFFMEIYQYSMKFSEFALNFNF